MWSRRSNGTLSREPDSARKYSRDSVLHVALRRAALTCVVRAEISTRDLRQERPFDRPIDTNSGHCAIGVA